MVHIRLRRGHHRLIRIFPTFAPRIVSRGRKCLCQVSASEDTFCFTSVAVVYRLRGEVLFRRFREMETTVPRACSLACDMFPRYGWEVMDQSPWSPHIAPRDLISSDPLSSIWLASSFQQTPKWSKLRRLEKTLDIDFVSASIHTSVPRWDESLNVSAE